MKLNNNNRDYSLRSNVTVNDYFFAKIYIFCSINIVISVLRKSNTIGIRKVFMIENLDKRGKIDITIHMEEMINSDSSSHIEAKY